MGALCEWPRQLSVESPQDRYVITAYGQGTRYKLSKYNATTSDKCTSFDVEAYIPNCNSLENYEGQSDN
jgi:hypothetical protein